MTWQIWIDTGGTFTDCIAISPEGKEQNIKVLSSSRLRGKIVEQINETTFGVQANWQVGQDIFKGYEINLLKKPKSAAQGKITVEKYDSQNQLLTLSMPLFEPSFPASSPKAQFVALDFEITAHEEAPILAARIATQTALNQALPSIQMRLGSTKGTNTLLERKGARVTFLITKGFKDLLRIGTQQRPNLFALNIVKPSLLCEEVIEVEERLDSNGNILIKLTDNEINSIIQNLKKQDVEAVAIAFLHSYLNPSHELLLRAKLLEAGFKFISLSSDLANAIKILPRGQTAVVNAYLSPVIHTYLSSIKNTILSKNNSNESSTLKVMTSAGGLIEADFFNPKDSLLSGPAGGIVGAAETAKLSGFQKIITLDIGGTSTDVARYDTNFDYQFETRINDIQLLSPSLAIETVAAGGGSLCTFDGFKLTVGPESAGANPGPACYGVGEMLAMTDVNLLLGRLSPENFNIPIEIYFAQQALEKVQKQIYESTGNLLIQSEILEGFVQIVNEKMAEAIRKISVSKGYNPQEYALLAFGGGGGQHACSVAKLLNINQIIIPYKAGLLSAFGMGMAQIERIASVQLLKNLQEVADTLQNTLNNLKEKVFQELQKEGFDASFIELKVSYAYLRFKGQDSTIEIAFADGSEKAIHLLIEGFKEKYIKIYGHWIGDAQIIEIESIKAIAVGISQKNSVVSKNINEENSYFPTPEKHTQTYFNGSFEETPIFIWEKLKVGATIRGTALLLSKNSSIFIEDGWELAIYAANNAVMKYSSANTQRTKIGNQAIDLELFTNRFKSIAEEMGALLQRTSFSVNVKERLDFSCALLDSEGELIVNAPHIPVHLGSLGICVRTLKNTISMQEGDVIITNHPNFGGSHLPDITLVAPVFSENQIVGYVANRAHHAEIGGKRPGSMPPDATCLAEEGVVIFPTYLIKNFEPQWNSIRNTLLSAPFPTRAVHENLADLNGALASVKAGIDALQQLCKKFSIEKVQFYMQALKDHAHESLQKSLDNFVTLKSPAVALMSGFISRSVLLSASESLDDGTVLSVRFEIEQNEQNEYEIIIDFAGTSPTHKGNLNATPAIVNSAAIYVLRLLLDTNIPLNEGIMRNVKLKIPTNTLLNPIFSEDIFECPAVVGGNTETSQRLVDTLLKVLGLAACSQGTMNNLLFGNEHFGYYETICGGTGAGDGFHGADAVHQHMTNTLITDAEVLELRYPVRLERFAIKEKSGGAGKWQGGNGIIREITFLANVSLSVLTQHRKIAPYGLGGGGSGEVGKQYIVRKNGQIELLRGLDKKEMESGDRIIMETPGGGGFGQR
ncbi:MAG: 5-oxoprolinase [Cytophagales bacterium]|nr:MAG: 5-oxoprolinase [Cytophagales bacterium]